MRCRGLSHTAESDHRGQVSFCVECGSLRPIGPSGPTEAWEPGLAWVKGGLENEEGWGWRLGTALGREGGKGKRGTSR